MPENGKANGDGRQSQKVEVEGDLVVVAKPDEDEKPNGKLNGHQNGNGHAAAPDVELDVNPSSNPAQDHLEWHRALKAQTDALLESSQKAVGGFGEDTGRFLEDQQKALGDAGGGFASLFDLSKLFGGEKDEDRDVTTQKAQQVVKKKLGLVKGPDILLKCIDSMSGVLKAADIKVTWDDSFEDVLVKLKDEFKRDVIFEYEVSGRVIRVQDDQAFDRAIQLAEGSGNKLYVVIQQAVWAEPIIEEPEPEEPEPEEMPLIITCYDRMSYSPAPYKPLLFFGGLGFFVSLLAGIVGYTSLGDDGPYLAAISLTIPVPYFVHGFTVQKTQGTVTTVIKFLVGIAGIVLGILTMITFIELNFVLGLGGGALWVLAITFYLWVTFPLIWLRAKVGWKRFHHWQQDFAAGKSKGMRDTVMGVGRSTKQALGNLTIKGVLTQWLILAIYMLVYGVIQYTPMQHGQNLVALKDKWVAVGKMYPRGDEKENHMICQGFTDPNATVDDRPVVLMESMEGLGQAAAMAKVAEPLSRIGIVCTYDRAGFGWSDRPTRPRTPTIIAQELFSMLNDNEVMVEIPARTNGTAAISRRVEAGVQGYVLVGHSVGSLYMRMFAASNPKSTAAMVLWDPLPSEDANLGEKFQSSANTVLGPGSLGICSAYLEPMGIIDLFFRSWITNVLGGVEFDKPILEGGIGDNYQRMVSRMLRPEWCPSVIKEWKDLYQGGKPGIVAVVDADIKRYAKPIIVWAREFSIYNSPLLGQREEDVYMDERLFNYTVEQIDACDTSNTQIQNINTSHPEGTSGWQCVAFKTLHYSDAPYENPHKRTCEIPGQPQLGNENPCPDISRSVSGGTELAPFQGEAVIAELVDTVLDAWLLLGYRTNFPSNPLAFVFQGFTPGECYTGGCEISVEDYRANFVASLMSVFGERFAETIQVSILSGPTRCPNAAFETPLLLGQLAVGDCPSTICTDPTVCQTPWTPPMSSRRSYWDLNEEPARQEYSTRAFSERAFYLVFQLLGHKASVVAAAIDVLTCTTDCETSPLSAIEASGISEDTEETRAAERQRRLDMMNSYNVTGILIGQRTTAENSTTWEVGTVAVLSGSFECPDNTYKFQQGCRQCPANSTSARGSDDQTSCKCDANFYLEVIDKDWTCKRCPDNTQSTCGSTLLTDCKCNPGYIGEDGGPCSACGINTYKAVRGNYNCTFCNATLSGCDKDEADLTTCHAIEVTAVAADGSVVHPLWGNVTMGSGWGTNCTIAVPEVGSCVNGSATLTEEVTEDYVHRGDFTQEFCDDPDVVVTPVVTSTGARILQRCVLKGNFGCEVYGNLSQQVWPVESVCELCDPTDSRVGVCCFSSHLVRPCREPGIEWPGGSPGHCTEVPALTLRDQGIVDFCATEDSNTTAEA